jgi:hypothetical protein
MFWAEQLVPASLLAPVDLAQPDAVGPRTRRDWVIDVVWFLFASAFGILLLSSELHESVDPIPTPQVVVDVVCGSLTCLSLWWRRRWPIGVALAGVLLGTFSISATAAGLLALFSLAVHRRLQPALLVAALWVPSALVFAIYSRRTDTVAAVLVATALVLAVTAWGMYVRARHQLLLTLRDRGPARRGRPTSARRPCAYGRAHPDRT